MLPMKLCGVLLACLFLVIADYSAISEDTPKENEQVDAIIDYLNKNPNSTYIFKEGQYVNSQLKVRNFKF